MNNALVADVSIASLIQILANAKEFYGLPVRHNEDVLNEGLTHLIPIKVPKHDLENPHVKANLLIQAHIERCQLPITDYFTDTKSVLDQSIRVLQGMIDVAAYKGSLKTTLNLIHLMQMIIQGAWLDQSILKNVPHFTDETVAKLGKQGIYYLPQLIDRAAGNLRKFLKQTLKETFSVIYQYFTISFSLSSSKTYTKHWTESRRLISSTQWCLWMIRIVRWKIRHSKKAVRLWSLST